MNPPENGAVELLREQLRGAWETLEGTTKDLTPETARWIPPGTALPIGAVYAHVVLAMDGVVNGLVRGKRPLFSAAFAGKTGTSSLHPGSAGGGPFDPDRTRPAMASLWSATKSCAMNEPMEWPSRMIGRPG